MLRQAVARMVPGGGIGHPDVIDRPHAVGLIEASEGDIDLRRAAFARIGERRAADTAEAALDSGRGGVDAKGIPVKLDRRPLDGEPSDGRGAARAAARFAVTPGRGSEQGTAAVTNGPARAAPGQPRSASDLQACRFD